MYPGDVSRGTDAAAFGLRGEFLFTVRVRVQTNDADANQELLLNMMDDINPLSVPMALLDEPTLGGLAGSLDVIDASGYVPYLAGEDSALGVPVHRQGDQGGIVIDVKLPISLEVGCGFGGEDAVDLLEQLADGRYDLMSVLPCPLTIEQWRDEHRTARKRAWRAFGRGYRAAPVETRARAGESTTSTRAPRCGRAAGCRQAYRPRSQSFAPLPDYPVRVTRPG